jgi:hypothetical protein
MVRLVPWSTEDFWLLERCNTPEMTAYLGGPETAEQLASRHDRYVANAYPGQMYTIRTLEGETAGSIGYWEHTKADESVWETGWAILPEHQGKGPGHSRHRRGGEGSRGLRDSQHPARLSRRRQRGFECPVPQGGLHLAAGKRIRVPQGSLDAMQ